MLITITGGRKSSQRRNALRQLGIALNATDPSEMVDSGHARHNGLVRSNLTTISVTCDLADEYDAGHRQPDNVWCQACNVAHVALFEVTQ